MLELVALTEPGPFLARTIELGDYLSIRRDGILVAMAGERFHPDGWTEISAICTKPDHRGQGLASRLVGALIASIQRRSERAFLHAMSSNSGAIGLYEAARLCSATNGHVDGRDARAARRRYGARRNGG